MTPNSLDQHVLPGEHFSSMMVDVGVLAPAVLFVAPDVALAPPHIVAVVVAAHVDPPLPLVVVADVYAPVLAPPLVAVVVVASQKVAALADLSAWHGYCASSGTALPCCPMPLDDASSHVAPPPPAAVPAATLSAEELVGAGHAPAPHHLGMHIAAAATQ